ncbi:MAG: 1-acyl-sn-glycerol-3-phosphate acyltransferase [Sedimentisphaerales bacterium]|nr:1-acyl-sn-glycerol-3-phosphate acyltransferase [Sedimentisphaerales bacterium]
MFRIRTYGRDNIPAKGPLLLLSNHQSYIDPLFCQVPIRRRLCYVARDSLFAVRFFGALVSTLRTIPIRRGQADIHAMKQIIARLKEGDAVCLYPEGTRTPDGRIETLKPGFSLLTRRTGATVVPVVIDGAFECWPRHRKLPRPGKVAVSYGEPIRAEEIDRMGDRAFAEELTRILRQMQRRCRLDMERRPFEYSPNGQENPDPNQEEQ